VKIMVLGIRGMPNVQGGIETHAEQLYQRLADLGCEVEVLVRAPFVDRGQSHHGAIRLRRLWSPRWPGLEAFMHSLIGVVYAGFARPDILHIHAIGPAIVAPIARLFGLKVVITHHGMDYEREKWGPVARTVLRTGEHLGMRHSHARIAVSRLIAEQVRRRHRLVVHHIPNGVEIHEPRSDIEHVRRFGLEPGQYFLHVGRMVPEKRQLELMQAYARQPRRWRLVLAGALNADAYSLQVQSAARATGTILAGYLKGEALQQLYSHAGAFVLPSSHEGLPIAMLEALSYGLPVLASDIPANMEVGLDSSSYYPLGDTDALAAGLARLEEERPDSQSRRARRLWAAERYDWQRIAEQTMSVYKELRQDRTQAGQPSPTVSTCKSHVK
jgi:glycosyltransferase involved in cell wall biosynthesis